MAFTLTTPLPLNVPVKTDVNFTQLRLRRYLIQASPTSIQVSWATGRTESGNFVEYQTATENIVGAEANAILSAPGNPALTLNKQLETGVWDWLVSKGKIGAGTVS